MTVSSEDITRLTQLTQTRAHLLTALGMVTQQLQALEAQVKRQRDLDQVAEEAARKAGANWLCPDCKAMTSAVNWKDCETYCEDCGDHTGVRCPACGECIDLVYADQRHEGSPETCPGSS